MRQLAANAGLPMPRVYIMDNPQPNAFATGRNPENAAVAVTTGLMRTVDEAELAGVIAHELGHIQNRDTLLMTITATVAGAISMLANFGLYFGGRSNDSGNIGIVGTLLLVILGPLAAALVQMAISRTREYEADRAGAEISRRPLSLASALQKIAGAAHRIPNMPAERNPASAHLFIVNPLSGARMDNLFSTHPNVENRVARLAGDGARDGRERRLITSRHERNGTVVPGAAGCGTRALGLAPPSFTGQAKPMTPSGQEARARARARDAQVGLPARRAAVELLAAVLQKKQALDDILGRSLEKGAMFDLPARDRALARAIVAASLRRKGELDHVLGTFLERGMPEKSGTLYPILLSAAAQLIFLDTPPHAAIDLAVTLAQYDPKATRYDKLVNAVLRRVAARGQGDRGAARCGARQYARLAVVALGQLLGRGPRA